MTTNETFFFRDKVPFDHFRETIMPAMMEARSRRAHPHLVRGNLDRAGAVFAGDDPEGDGARRSAAGESRSSPPTCRSEVLEKAKAGIFSQFEVQRGLPIQLLVKHFTQIDETWQLSPEIRAMVQFKQLNLLHDFAQLGTFDIIFCRNVLIYFDQATKVDVFNRLAQGDRAGRLPRARRGRNRGRPERRLQSLSRAARPLSSVVHGTDGVAVDRADDRAGRGRLLPAIGRRYGR